MTQNAGGQVWRQGFGWVERTVVFTEDDFADEDQAVEAEVDEAEPAAA